MLHKPVIRSITSHAVVQTSAPSWVGVVSRSSIYLEYFNLSKWLLRRCAPVNDWCEASRCSFVSQFTWEPVHNVEWVDTVETELAVALAPVARLRCPCDML